MAQCASFIGAEAQQHIVLELQQCLNSLPDDLDHYYATIIERLPHAIRMETYILLESIAKSTTLVTTGEVRRLIRSGLAQTFEQGDAYSDDFDEVAIDNYLRTISGGLVDIVAYDNCYIIQLFHQTCKEWVESSNFKHVVLGSRANATWENGHSFLVKFYAQELVRCKDKLYISQLLRHNAEAESTTGVSLYVYLSQLPPVFYRSMAFCGWSVVHSGISLAICSCSRLFMQDFIDRNKLAIQNTDEKLFCALLFDKFSDTIDTNRNTAQIVETGHFLLEHGLKLENDPLSIAVIMYRTWECPNRTSADLYMGLMRTAVGCSLDPNVPFCLQSGFYSFFSKSTHIHTHAKFQKVSDWKLLHLSPPPLAQWLLEFGAAVNEINSAGQTPLDYVIHPKSLHQSCHFGIDWLYEISLVLLNAGGVLMNTDIDSLNRFTARLAENGFEIRPLTVMYEMVKTGGASETQLTGAMEAPAKLRKREKMKRLLRLS
ncbi:hypothetical protein HJFPF1_07023 [Paramyrothecium foliicola]|nr:hypothetical protein HJFPF1_07023 [Paramyrothecium foliicola]